MKLSKKILLAVSAATVLLCFAGCSDGEKPAAPTTEQESLVYSASSYATINKSRAVEEAEKNHPEMVNNPQFDSKLFGTWQSGFYTDVIHFSNDACYGRVELDMLDTGLVSEGGIYCTDKGIIKVLAYRVQNGDEAGLYVPDYHEYGYSVKNGVLTLNGKTFYRVK